MHKEPDFKWMFLDLNSYFASVEQQENPSLRGKPVAVVPLRSDHTCAIAASAEAKLYGVKTGTIIRDAHRMCPNLTCVLARHDIYVDYHHRILSELSRHIPINKVWSIDELSSRLPPNKRNIESAQHIAHKIRSGLRDNVGEMITASIGFAPNSWLAKIASDMKKPNGVTMLTHDTLQDTLFRLKLLDLPGVGRNMLHRLKSAGINTVEDFWNTSPKQARRLWGNVEGERLWYLMHGYDIERPATKNVMIGHSRVLDPNLRAPNKAHLMARRLMTKAATRLRNKHYYTRSIILSVRSTEGKRWSAERRILPVQDPFSLLAGLDHLWAEMANDMRCIQDLRFKKISVLLMGLIKPEEITNDLLEITQPDRRIRNLKNESLTRALDELHHKYQRDVVTFGVPPKTLAGYVGTKIAFNRVPDREEFWS